MFEVFTDVQQGHYVRNTSPTSVKARAAKHAVNHLDPNLLSRGETYYIYQFLLIAQFLNVMMNWVLLQIHFLQIKSMWFYLCVIKNWQKSV